LLLKEYCDLANYNESILIFYGIVDNAPVSLLL